MRRTPLCLFAAVCLGIPAETFAWNRAGHQVVATIAYVMEQGLLPYFGFSPMTIDVIKDSWARRDDVQPSVYGRFNAPFTISSDDLNGTSLATFNFFDVTIGAPGRCGNVFWERSMCWAARILSPKTYSPPPAFK